MPALLSYAYRTLSRHPRFSRHKLFMEGDPFAFEVRVTNDGSQAFPDSEMLVKARWVFASGDSEEHEIALAKGELGPGASKSETGEIELEAAGYTHLYVSYVPHDRSRGVTLHDAKGREIAPAGKSALACFRGTSVIELLSFWAIVFACVSTAIAALALAVSLIAFLHL